MLARRVPRKSVEGGGGARAGGWREWGSGLRGRPPGSPGLAPGSTSRAPALPDRMAPGRIAAGHASRGGSPMHATTTRLVAAALLLAAPGVAAAQAPKERATLKGL